MKPNSVGWTIALFFGCSIAFAALHRLTRHQSTAVSLLVQVGALVVIIGAVVLVVRRRSRN